jgi:hypothetical protein
VRTGRAASVHATTRSVLGPWRLTIRAAFRPPARLSAAGCKIRAAAGLRATRAVARRPDRLTDYVRGSSEPSRVQY